MRFKVENSRLFRLRTTQKDENVYFNEVNTMPGFTTISMYPQLFEKCGLSYSELLDKLITLAIEK